MDYICPQKNRHTLKSCILMPGFHIHLHMLTLHLFMNSKYAAPVGLFPELQMPRSGSHMWLFRFKSKLIKSKRHLKFSAFSILAIFQVLKSHLWSVVVISLDSTAIEHNVIPEHSSGHSSIRMVAGHSSWNSDGPFTPRLY